MKFKSGNIIADINQDHPDVKACKSVADLKKLDLLTGGTDEDYKALFDQLKGKTEAPANPTS